MTRFDVILQILLSQPVYELDREDSPEARREMLVPVAHAIALAADEPLEVAALVAIGKHESNFARYVVEGRCLDGPSSARCDPDKLGKPRARGPWQVWAWCSRAWSLPAGSQESLAAEASCALRTWRAAKSRCRHEPDPIAAAFAGYRRSTCTWVGARARAATVRGVLARIARLGLP